METTTITTTAPPLAEERAYFAANQAEWQQKYPGKFVLVKENSLINTFEKAEDAIEEGLERYGLNSFLVRSVERQDELFIPALSFGILTEPAPSP